MTKELPPVPDIRLKKKVAQIRRAVLEDTNEIADQFSQLFILFREKELEYFLDEFRVTLIDHLVHTLACDKESAGLLADVFTEYALGFFHICAEGRWEDLPEADQKTITNFGRDAMKVVRESKTKNEKN